MSKEVMRQALEALKELVAQTEIGLFAARHDHVAMQDARQAITALREALAEQPAQRTWVGLSDAQSTVIWANSQSVDEAIRATEKQLMENNI